MEQDTETALSPTTAVAASLMNEYETYNDSSTSNNIYNSTSEDDDYNNDYNAQDDAEEEEEEEEYESDEDDIYFDPITGSILPGKAAAQEYVESASVRNEDGMDRGLSLEEEAEEEVRGVVMGGGNASLVSGERSDSGTVTITPTPSTTEDDANDNTTERSMPALKEEENTMSQSRALPTTPTTTSQPQPPPPPPQEKKEEEIDPEIARAEAMALAFQRNPNLTPEELMLIVAPDVQQKKLVEEKLKKQQHNPQSTQNQGLHFSAAGLRQSLNEFVSHSSSALHVDSLKHHPGVSVGGQRGRSDPTASSTLGSFKGPAAAAAAGGGGGKPQSLQESIKEANMKAKKKWAETFTKQPTASTAAAAGTESTAAVAGVAVAVGATATSASKTTTTKDGGLKDEKEQKISAAPSEPSNAAKTAATATSIVSTTTTTNKVIKTTTTTVVLPKTSPTKTTFENQKPSPSPKTTPQPSPTQNKLVTFQKSPLSPSTKKQTILSDVVYKRRSGFGKHSLRNAWEKRRIVLKGSILYYYKCDADLNQAVKKLGGGEKDVKTIVDLNELEGGTVVTEDSETSLSQDELLLPSSSSCEEDDDDCSETEQPWNDNKMSGPSKSTALAKGATWVGKDTALIARGTTAVTANMVKDTGKVAEIAVKLPPKAGIGAIQVTKAAAVTTGGVIGRAGTENNEQDAESEEEAKKIVAVKLLSNANTKKSLWEQAAIRIETAKDSIAKAAESYGIDVPNAAGVGMADPNSPRGVIDLVKERATASATCGHSGAPTPFAVSIKIKGETKWKFCFQSRNKQMKWLAAITDVVVRSSLVEYNATLLEEQDIGAGGAAVGGGGGVATAAGVAVGGATTVGGVAAKGLRGQLWKMDDYNISSRDVFAGVSTEEDKKKGKEGTEEEKKDGGKSAVDTEDDEEQGYEDDEEEMMYEGPSLRGNDLYVSAALVNCIVLFAHMVSPSTLWFCLLVLSLNGGLWFCAINNPFGGNDDAGSAIQDGGDGEAGEARRRSSRRSIRKRSSKKKSAHGVDGDDRESKKSRQVAAAEVIPSDGKAYKPTAGTTTLLVKDPADSKKLNGNIFVKWRQVPGAHLNVRSHGYLSTKKKIPSPSELYECVRVDMFESDKRIPNMAPRVVLPKVQFDDGDVKKNWHSPDIFVVSVAIPIEAPRMTRPTDDGLGYTITLYLKMKEETREVLRRISAPGYGPKTDKKSKDGTDIQKSIVNAVRLWEEWCRRSPKDKTFQSRFKFIPSADNPKEIGLPGWIAKYNGKPVLIKRDQVTGFLYNHPELNAMEFNITLHPFPYLAKQALSYLKEHIFKKSIVTYGFVIEGRDDDELPEVVVGCTQFCYPDPADIISSNDFFAGKSPKSFENE